MFAYRTPGVYFETQDHAKAAPISLRTDIAGFVGIAECGELHRPIKIKSTVQFESVFGGPIPQGYLAEAVSGFFANGGRECWVVRAAHAQTASKGLLDLKDELDNTVLRLQATSPGRWSNHVLVTLRREGDDNFSLVLRYEERGEEFWTALSLSPSYLQLLDGQGVPRLQLTGIHPELYEPDSSKPQPYLTLAAAEASQSGNADYGRFDLKLYVHNELKEAWQGVSLDPDDNEAYVVKAINDSANKSQFLIAKDLKYGVAGTLDPSAANLYRGQAELLANPRYVVARLNDKEKGSDRVRATHFHSSLTYPANTPTPLAEGFKAGTARLSPGNEGLAAMETTDLIGDNDADVCKGLQCLESIDEIALLAIPDIMTKPKVIPEFQIPPVNCRLLEPGEPAAKPLSEDIEFPPQFTTVQIEQMQKAMVNQCEKLKDRFALLDTPIDAVDRTAVKNWRKQFDTAYGALFYPWIATPDSMRLQGLLRQVPPSGHVAGIYARNDLQRGIHKPPANLLFEDVQATASEISDDEHGELNEHAINAIRHFLGRGIRVAGARTLSSNNNWRFVNVRRLMIFIAESLEVSARGLVFEANNENLWRRVDRMVRNFIDSLWRAGILDGANADAAYRVRCDAETNPPEEFELGRIWCELELNPPWPAEFVIVRIGFTENGAVLMTEGI